MRATVYISAVLALALPALAAAQEIAVNERHKLSGPRVGVSVISGISRERLADEFHLRPFAMEFGWQSEQLVAPRPGGVNFVVREVVMLGGIEQGTIFPSLTATVGIRDPRGLELAVGPSFSALGGGVAFTAGWNFVYGTTSLPVSVTVAQNGDATRIMLIGGFAIETMRRAGAEVR